MTGSNGEARLLSAGGRFYFCMGCSSAPALTAVTNLTAGCLYRQHTYQRIDLRAAAVSHNCRQPDRQDTDSLHVSPSCLDLLVAPANLLPCALS